MESPAIIIGVIFHRFYTANKTGLGFSWSGLFRDAFLNGSVLLLMGSLVIGLVTGERGGSALKPFTEDIFTGVLALFLLDMGLIAARRIGDLKKAGAFLAAFALFIPLVNAAAGILISYLMGMPKGDALMFSILCASASYIAVPAAMRLAIPEANPSLYVPMALAITFPFNIVAGLPLYMFIINWLWR